MRAGPDRDGRDRHLSRASSSTATVESLEPRHRPDLLAAAGGERHRQLGQGRAAPAGAPRARQTRPNLPLHAGLSATVEVDTRHRRPWLVAAPSKTGICPAPPRTRERRSGDRRRQPLRHFAAGQPRALITVSIMLATFMQGVDTTIANVALPHMQGSLSASQDQIAWVLTSYIVAVGDHDAADRLARRPVRHQIRLPRLGHRLHVASALCGAATSLAQLVLFRLLQGVCGAGAGAAVAGDAVADQPAASGTARRWRSGAWA